MMIFVSFCMVALGGLGYFTIWRLTDHTSTAVDSQRNHVLSMLSSMKLVVEIIVNLDKRFKDLETEIRLQKSDSSRLIQWLEEESKARINFAVHVEEKISIQNDNIKTFIEKFGNVIRK